MKSNFIDDPRTLTLSAMILGYLLIADYNSQEQNAIGNWFMLVGQVLETNSAILQLYNYNKNNMNNINLNNINKDDLLKIKKMLENLINKIDIN